MPKLPNKKITLYDLDKLTPEERSDALEPVIKANEEQFRQAAKTIAEATSFAKLATSIASSFKLPDLDFLKDFKLPELPVTPDLTGISLERYDPPVTIRKSKWEIEKEAREAYMTELQIQVLEQQLNLYKGMLAPQYDINTGVITFMGKKIEIPLNTKMEMVCRVVLKNMTNMKRKWSWDEIVEENRETLEGFTHRQIYTATRAINEKVALETSVKDFLLAKPLTTVQLNPAFLAK